MDGVLINSEPLINSAAIAMFKEKVRWCNGRTFRPSLERDDGNIRGVVEKYHFSLDLPAANRQPYEIYFDLVKSQLEAFPGVHDLARTCREAALLKAVASSADEIKVAANLQKFGLQMEFWDAVVTGCRKQEASARHFLIAVRNFGINPFSFIVVEDQGAFIRQIFKDKVGIGFVTIHQRTLR